MTTTLLKIWLDDVRTPPDGSWNWAKTASEAIAMLEEYVPKLDIEIYVSLDFDLGQVDVCGNGMDVAKYICDLSSERLKRMSISIHSQNPVGAAQMRDLLRDRMVTL